MRIVRTFLWVVLTALLVTFIAMNWHTAPVNIWPVETGYLHFEWPIGFIALVFFVLGIVPMWLVYRAARWQSARRITTLENAARAASLTPNPPPLANAPPSTSMLDKPPLATSTQLDAVRATDHPQI